MSMLLALTYSGLLGHGDGWGHMNWGGWGVFLAALMMLLFAGLVVAVVWLVTRSGGGSDRRPQPEEILAERYARGEISTDEYRERLEALD